MDGWISIGTKLDSKQLEKDLKDEETRLRKYTKENEVLINAKVKIEKSKAMKEYQQLKDAIERTYDNKIELAQQDKYLGYEKSIEKYNIKKVEEVQKLNEAYSEQLSKIEEINQKLITNSYNQELTKNKIEEINVELGKSQNWNKIQNYLNETGNKTENIIKKVAKWGLAIFSIRSAYNFIRQSVSTLSQYNKKLATDIEYLRYSLASALQPIIENIIQLIYKILAYINYIAQAWFGVNIFANASVKSFEKAKKSLSGSNKQAKELQKTLAGFDEMNILQDGSTNKGGGGGGVTLPSFDLGKMEDVPIPGWVQWIADNGTTVAVIIGLIGTAIAGLKLAGLVANLEKAGIHVLGLFDSLSKFSGLQIFGMVAGFAVTIVGLVETIGSLITFINDPSWENFTQVLSGLETVLIGVGIALVALNASNPIGWISIAIGVLGKFIGALRNEENATKDLTKAKQKLQEAEMNFVNAQNTYVSAVKRKEQAYKDLQKAEKKSKTSGEELYKSVLMGETSYDKLSDANKKTYLAYVQYRGAVNNLENATSDLQTKEHDLILETLNTEGANAVATKSFEDLGKAIGTLVDNEKISVDEANDVIQSVFDNLDDNGKQLFKDLLPKYINSSSDAVKTLISKLDKAYEKYQKLSKSFIGLTPYSTVSDKTLWAKGGVLTYAKGGIYKPIKLASGAIVNQPGRGVPIGHNAIAGEHGAEGIIPLTDSQQMDLLGSAIAKRVIINLTNVTQMNGRTISRELKQVQSEDSFAFNG